MSGKAILIKERTTPNFGAHHKVYRLSPPVDHEDYAREGETRTHEHVTVSAASVPFSGPETYIFPSDADGNFGDFGELNGSYRVGLDHEKALRGLGYELEGE